MTGRYKSGSVTPLLGALLLAFGFLFSGVANLAAAGFVAGVEPDRRRTDIPVVSQAKRDAAWQIKALSGLSKPYPGNVQKFLGDQGNWFSPFLHPGMVDRYDIRGWHKSKKQ